MQEWGLQKVRGLTLRNKMTEKDYNPEQRNKKAMEKPKAVKPEVAKTSERKIASPKGEGDKGIDNKENAAVSKIDGKEVKTDDKKPEKKKQPVVQKVKKDEAVVKGISLSLSTKTSVAVCRFIKGKKISDAIADLEQVVVKKKAVPMKGEIPHRKGKIMSGRFPKNASESFIHLLKNLQANANVNGLEEPIVAEAMANIASQPYGKFGRVRRKRTHVLIKAKEKVNKKKSKEATK